MSTIELFFDYGSPYSYLACEIVPGLAAEHGAELLLRPMLLGGVFKATGNQSPMFETVEAKRSYGGRQLPRTAALHGVPFASNPHFPINTLELMRLATAAQAASVFPAFHAAVLPALWQHGRDLGDAAVRADVMKAAGLDADALVARAASAEAKAALRATTEEAVSRGVFGAPTLFVGDEMFFGVDHLPHLVRALEEASA